MNTGRNRPAFTLVELMIVIVIISILAGLTTIGTRIAIHNSKDATVSLTLEQLAMAIEKYKNDIGEYPPDFTDQDAVVRHVRKRWPRCNYADTFFQTAENKLGWTFGPASALVFWLGGLPDNTGKPGGFFLSPTDPLRTNPETSPQREEPRYNFPDGTIFEKEYITNRSPEEWVTGPVFQPGKDDSKPVVYFCASAPSAENDLNALPEDVLTDSFEIENAAYQTILNSEEKFTFFKGLGFATPYARDVKSVGDLDCWTWYESDRFQLVHPGYDGLFSDFPDSDFEGPIYPYPYINEKKAELTPADYDNIVNFAEGGTLESLYPKLPRP